MAGGLARDGPEPTSCAEEAKRWKRQQLGLDSGQPSGQYSESLTVQKGQAATCCL